MQRTDAPGRPPVRPDAGRPLVVALFVLAAALLPVVVLSAPGLVVTFLAGAGLGGVVATVDRGQRCGACDDGSGLRLSLGRRRLWS